ncbi:MAG: pseudouridine synthase [Desulfocapsaceae bacterium]|nr:pseudouridine synthase [Desulfocapsaceae bacterium]
MSQSIRLQKYLAQCGIASRRKAEILIAEGRVSVDGRIVDTMGVKIDPEVQNIFFDGKPVILEKEKIYILLNKPVGYVTTAADPQGRPIVTDLIGDIDERLFPVGRLDLDTQGALLLTNDGELAQKMQHPSFEVKKTYEALVVGKPKKKDLVSLEKGIVLEGKKTSPAQLVVIKKFSASTLIRIIIHEGRKRQVRKMFAAIGHPVNRLKRIAYGSLYLKNIPEGSYRRLNKQDLKKIFKNISLQMKK